MILESLGIAKYFSFQHLSYVTGFEKPTREAFRNARQTGLRIGKGNPSYTTRDPISRAELRKKWLGWDFVHVGDDVSHDWCAARKVMDIQPVWLDRAGAGLWQGDTMTKFIKRSTDEYPVQMIHMAEGMKNWGNQKWTDDKRWKLLSTPKPKSSANLTPEQLRNELRNSTITDLTELPHLFPHYHIPPETEDGNPVSIALLDPDKWGDEVKKLGEERAQANRETLAMVSQLRWPETKKYWEQRERVKKHEEGMKGQAKEGQKILTKYLAKDTERGSYSRRYSNGREEISGVSTERAGQPEMSGKAHSWKLGRNAKNAGGRRNVSSIKKHRESGTGAGAQATHRRNEAIGESQWDWYRRR